MSQSNGNIVPISDQNIEYILLSSSSETSLNGDKTGSASSQDVKPDVQDLARPISPWDTPSTSRYASQPETPSSVRKRPRFGMSNQSTPIRGRSRTRASNNGI